mgnify:FL=1
MTTALARRLPVVNAALCGPCGGRCCKSMPGAAMPEDFADLAALEAAILTGRWTLDWLVGDVVYPYDLDRVLFPRPAIVGCEGSPSHGAYGGQCTFLGATGCELAYERRPVECRELEPGILTCESRYWKEDFAAAWRPHAAELEEMLVRLWAVMK